MTLFFDIKTLEQESDNNLIKFVQILEDHYNKVNKVNLFESKTRYKPIHGKSYLLNPLPLFRQTVDIAYIVQYIKLAAKRDYTLYKLFKDCSLPLSFFPDINKDVIKHNPLINITNTQIQFKFEEINGTKIRRH